MRTSWPTNTVPAAMAIRIHNRATIRRPCNPASIFRAAPAFARGKRFLRDLPGDSVLHAEIAGRPENFFLFLCSQLVFVATFHLIQAILQVPFMSGLGYLLLLAGA